MKPCYFTDTHISVSATTQLRLKGLDVVRCEEVALAEASDETLLTYAADENRVLISCDRDFIDLHFQWLADERHHAGIIYLHPDRHCKHIGEIVRIVVYWHSVAEVAEDLYNEIWKGDDAQ